MKTRIIKWAVSKAGKFVRVWGERVKRWEEQKRIDVLPEEWMVIKANIKFRDRYTCQRCGSRDDLTVDHIIPLAEGGTTVASNLWTLCDPCHTEKTKRSNTAIAELANSKTWNNKYSRNTPYSKFSKKKSSRR